MLPRALALALLALAALAAPASAQGPHTGGAHTGGAAATAPRDPFSRDYTEATRAWHEGRYDEALERFRALYDQSGRGELLYDIGVTADRLGRLDEAIEAFESYLASVPGARNRAEVEQRLASLREDLREQQHITTRPTPPPERATPPRADRPVMTLMGAQPSAAPPAASRSVVISTPRETPPHDDLVVVEDGGPTFVWTWPFLVLTAGAAIAAPIVWLDGEGRRDDLLAQCQSGVGSCDLDYVRGELEGHELATNALWISAVGLGVITAIVFFVEGAGRRTVVRHVASREVAPEPVRVRVRVGLGGLAVEGSF